MKKKDKKRPFPADKSSSRYERASRQGNRSANTAKIQMVISKVDATLEFEIVPVTRHPEYIHIILSKGKAEGFYERSDVYMLTKDLDDQELVEQRIREAISAMKTEYHGLSVEFPSMCLDASRQITEMIQSAKQTEQLSKWSESELRKRIEAILRDAMNRSRIPSICIRPSGKTEPMNKRTLEYLRCNVSLLPDPEKQRRAIIFFDFVYPSWIVPAVFQVKYRWPSKSALSSETSVIEHHWDSYFSLWNDLREGAVSESEFQAAMVGLKTKKTKIQEIEKSFGDIVGDTVLRLVTTNPDCLDADWVKFEVDQWIKSRDHKRIGRLAKHWERHRYTVKLPPSEALKTEYEWLVRCIRWARQLIHEAKKETPEIEAYWKKTKIREEALEELADKYSREVWQIRKKLEGKSMIGRPRKRDHDEVARRFEEVKEETASVKVAKYRVGEEFGYHPDWVERIWRESKKVTH